MHFAGYPGTVGISNRVPEYAIPGYGKTSLVPGFSRQILWIHPRPPCHACLLAASLAPSPFLHSSPQRPSCPLFCCPSPPASSLPKTWLTTRLSRLAPALFLSLLLSSFRSRSLPLPSSFLLPLSLFLSSSSLLLAPALFLYSSRSRSLPLFLVSESSCRSRSVPLFLKLPLCSSLPLAPALFLCSSRSHSVPVFLSIPLFLSSSSLLLSLSLFLFPWILTSLPGS